MLELKLIFKRLDMNFNVNEFNKLVRTRRSIFPTDYSGERVDDSIVSQMLENANWAPNHRLTEPWRFTVYTDDGLKKLGEIQAKVYKEVTEVDGTFSEKKYHNLLNKPASASHVIVVGMKRDPQFSVPEIEEVCAVACAVQNMYLTAAAYEVGCYWGTGGITYFEESKEHFGLGKEDKLLGFFYVGIPNKWPISTKRGEIEDKVRWVM